MQNVFSIIIYLNYKYRVVIDNNRVESNQSWSK